jgi:sigma-B regulation protein RsbU (phosphoserine phosphatase)
MRSQLNIVNWRKDCWREQRKVYCLMALQEAPRLLVICNEDEQRSDLVEHLHTFPYRLHYSGDIHRLASGTQDEYDLVLLSCDLPEEQSHQVLAQWQAAGKHLQTPVLVFAPCTAQQAIEQHLQLGAADFIFTPATPALLQARIENLLALCQLRQHERNPLKDPMALKLEHDLQVARRIQAGFLPRTLPQVRGWEIGARFQPAREVAGDFYDVFMLSQNRRIAIVIADVVDKGIPAALFMALVRSLTRAFAQQNYSLSWTDVLGSDLSGPESSRKPRRRTIPSTGTMSLYNAVFLTNNYIVDNHMDDNMFATLFFGLLDPLTGQLAYINAGHNPPFIFDAQGNLKAALKNTGTAVGMFPDIDYTIANTQMQPGDILFAYTDGVTEARRATGEFVTEKGLLSLLADPAGSATELLDRVDLFLQTFMRDADQFDDITMMAIRYAHDY